MDPTLAPEARLSHPVAAVTDLGEAPLSVRLLGEDWVLWRDAAGVPRAAPDRCPHRGTRLSLGRVCGGELECPYHGWRFDGAGRCTRVPAVPGWVPPAGHGLAVRPLTEALGLLWLNPAGDAPPPPFAAESEPRLRKLNVGPFDIATSAPRVVENFLDMAHFAFVHEGWLGDRGHAEVAPFTVEQTPEGLHARGCRAWQPRSNLQSTEGSWVDYDYRVPAPYAAVLEKAPDAQAGWREAIALLVCPQDDEHCRAWFRLALPDAGSADEAIAAFQHTIFGQDQPVLESQRPRRLPLTGEVHCAADRLSTAYRRHLAALGVICGVLR